MQLMKKNNKTKKCKTLTLLRPAAVVAEETRPRRRGAASARMSRPRWRRRRGAAEVEATPRCGGRGGVASTWMSRPRRTARRRGGRGGVDGVGALEANGAAWWRRTAAAWQRRRRGGRGGEELAGEEQDGGARGLRRIWGSNRRSPQLTALKTPLVPVVLYNRY